MHNLANRRTVDAIFVLSVIEPVFACFVDFAKTFDTVDHSILWQKLPNIGLGMNMLNLLEDRASSVSRLIRKCQILFLVILELDKDVT